MPSVDQTPPQPQRQRRTRCDGSPHVRRRVLVLAVFFIVVTMSLLWNRPSAKAVDVSLNNKKNDISKILHFVYVSQGIPDYHNPIPISIQNTTDGWKALHPGWEVRVWDNVAVRQEFPHAVPFWASIQTMAWVADLIRYHVLERFGGIYLDTDIVGLKSLEPFLKFSAFTVCQEPFQERTDFNSSDLEIMPSQNCSLACNAVIGARPHHPALQQIITSSMNNTRNVLQANPNSPYNLKHSGPIAWTWDAHMFPDVTFLRSFTFYPCHWTERKNCVKEKYESDPRVFAMHEWAGSWLPKWKLAQLNGGHT